MKTMLFALFTRTMLFLGGVLSLISTQKVLAQADCSKKWGVDSVQTIQNISLYREFYKQKNFSAALEPWRYVFEQAPCSREQTHIDGIVMFKDRLKAQKDSSLRTPLIDTLMLIYDARAKYFPKSASNALGRKALDMLEFIPGQNQRIREAFEEAVRSGGQATEPFVLGYYFKVAIKEFKGGALTQTQIFELYNQLAGIADANMANPSLDSTKRLRFAENKAALDADLSISVIENCEQILENFEAKFAEGNTDKSLRDLIYNQLRIKNCKDSEFYEKVAISKFADDPQPALGIELARRFHKSSRSKEADTYYQQALQLVTDDSVKAQYTMDYAALFSEDKQYDKARDLALQAQALRPTWGKPLIFIGNLYAASYNVCGGGIAAQAVYWAAVDKFKQAARINPEFQAECDQLISKYSGYFPKKETLFFNNPPYKGGDAYRVGCWIQESTSVRTSD
ncbi:MAG: tetratricopeptide repeat protein [Bacteroidia bacterium]